MAKLSNGVVDQLKLQLQSAKMRLTEEEAVLVTKQEKRNNVVAQEDEKLSAQKSTIEAVKAEIDALQNAVDVLYANLPDLPEEPATEPAEGEEIA